jgi:hypothetical protein
MSSRLLTPFALGGMVFRSGRDDSGAVRCWRRPILQAFLKTRITLRTRGARVVGAMGSSHKLAPSVRPKRCRMSDMAMFQQLCWVRLPIGEYTNCSTPPVMKAGIADSPLEGCGTTGVRSRQRARGETRAGSTRSSATDSPSHLCSGSG